MEFMDVKILDVINESRKYENMKRAKEINKVESQKKWEERRII